MSSTRLWCCLVILTVLSHTQAIEPNLAGDEYVFELKDDNDAVCFYASFQLDFKISYLSYANASNQSNKDVMSLDIKLPNNTQVQVSGECHANETTMLLSWEYGDKMYNSSFVFTVTNQSWYANFISFTFDLEMGVQTYVTNKTNLFSRDFTRNDFFYCEKCKTFSFVNCSEETGDCVNPCPKNSRNESECNSTLDMMLTVMYPGDIEKQGASRMLCIEDYIALQELIVPIVVGGILAILLVLIFVAYIIAYIRRRRREGKYERLGETTY